MEADVALLWSCWLLAGSIGLRSSGELLEFHDVASECTSLIREDVFDLAKLFIQVGRLSPHCHVLLFIEHHILISHKYHLPELYQLKGHHQ